MSFRATYVPPVNDRQQGHPWSGEPWSRSAGAVSGTPWTAGPQVPPEPVGPDLTRNRLYLVALGVAALGLGLLLGMGIGVAASDDQAAVDELSQQVSFLQKQATDAEQVATDARTEAAADVASARADALAAVTAENAARQAELDARSAELDAREGGLAQREDAVTVLEQQAADGSLPGDGVYLVGTEVAPGTYRAASPADCYWERRSGLSGEFSDVITNGLGASDATVTIRASDVAFSSSRCGTWSRIN